MPKLARQESDVLTRQQFSESGPGTILKDFQTLLDFVGTEGIQTGGKHYRLPLAALGALDERMSHPLRPNLNRPQQLSYPHLNGLYLLFRTSGLGVSSGQRNSGRLSVNPDRLAEWRTLNPVEKYFTLFQTMLTSEWSPIESGSGRNGPWQELTWKLDAWSHDRTRTSRDGASISEFTYGWRAQTTAALLELFGILEIPRVEPQEGESWRITTIRATEFGSAFLGRLGDPSMMVNVFGIFDDRSDKRGKWFGDFFRECYPDCRKTLTDSRDQETFVDGVWQFKVSLGEVWRRIVIPADSNVDELIGGIISGFKFDFDHLYELQVRDRSGRNIQIGHRELDSCEYLTDEFAVGSLPLDPGQSMTLLYDFGDCWRFKVKFERILPRSRTVKRMKIIEKKGKAPAQYGDTDGFGDEW